MGGSVLTAMRFAVNLRSSALRLHNKRLAVAQKLFTRSMSDKSQSIKHHYESHSGDSYESAWFYQSRSEYQNFVADKVLDALCLPPAANTAENVVDVGCGTGNFTTLLREKYMASRQVVPASKSASRFVGVEPYLRPTNSEGVEFAQAGVDDFLRAQLACRGQGDWYSRFLFKEVVHHFDFEKVFSLLHKYFASGNESGRAVIVTRPQDSSHYPFFRGAHEEWRRHQQHVDHYVAALQRCGFDWAGCGRVETHTHEYSVCMPITQWKTMIRQRFWSTFHAFSDDEIEQGLDELGGLEQFLDDGSESNIRFPDQLVFIVASFSSEEHRRVQHFRSFGFVPSVGPIIERKEMEERIRPLFEKFRAYVQANPLLRWSEMRFKPHLLLPWLHQALTSNERLIRYAKQFLQSETIVIWSTDFCVKEAGSRSFFSWHQDSTYSGWKGGEGITVWLAFSDVQESAGPVMFKTIPSLELRQFDHQENLPREDGNMLSFGQFIEDADYETNFALGDVVTAILPPGSASVHNFYVVHSSQENNSGSDRVGLAIRLLRGDSTPTSNLQSMLRRDRVTLLCGHSEEVCTHFELESQIPIKEFGDMEMKEWRASMEREKEIYFHGKEQRDYR